MRSRDALLVAYAAAAIAHLGALAAGVDPLAVATKVVLVPLLLGWVLLAGRPAPRLLVVALVLAGVGALAAGVSVRVGLGGLLFFVSDSLIAVGVADHDFTGRDVAVMGTCALAQYLIASGWLSRSRSRRVGGSAP